MTRCRLPSLLAAALVAACAHLPPQTAVADAVAPHESPWVIRVGSSRPGADGRKLLFESKRGASTGWGLATSVPAAGAWLGPDTVWTVTVPDDKRKDHHLPNAELKAWGGHRAAMGPLTLSGRRPRSYALDLADRSDPHLYAVPGHYEVRALEPKWTGFRWHPVAYAELFVLDDGRAARTEILCSPLGEFPWPGSDSDFVGPDKAVRWRISWIDDIPFDGCPAGQQLDAWSVNLVPPAQADATRTPPTTPTSGG